MKRYEIDLQLNTRDLGGYVTSQGFLIPEGQFIRSDVPQYLSPQGRDFFYQLGITHVLDFRTDDIGTRYPSVFSQDARFNYRRFPIVEGSQANPTHPDDSPKTYMRMLTREDTFRGIFHVISHATGGVFYHCTAGKDRTGVVTFLLLDLVGVSEQTIIEDYAVSEVFINANIHKVRALHPDFPASLGYSKAWYMEQFIPLFRATYGSAEAYLLKIGITAEEIKSLKQRLTTKSVNG